MNILSSAPLVLVLIAFGLTIFHAVKPVVPLWIPLLLAEIALIVFLLK